MIDFSPLWETMRKRNVTQYQLLKNGIDNKTLDALKKNDKKRILALTEFGGYAFLEEKKRRSIFSYRKFRTQQAFMQALNQLYLRQIVPTVKKDGLCAIVYTQLSDVETEVNGIFTADWKLKVDEAQMRSLNEALYRAFSDALPPDETDKKA